MLCAQGEKEKTLQKHRFRAPQKNCRELALVFVCSLSFGYPFLSKMSGHVCSYGNPLLIFLGVHATQLLGLYFFAFLQPLCPSFCLCTLLVVFANALLSHRIPRRVVPVWLIPSSELDLGIFVADIFLLYSSFPLAVWYPFLLSDFRKTTVFRLCPCFTNQFLILFGACLLVCFEPVFRVCFFHQFLPLHVLLVMCSSCSQPAFSLLMPSSLINSIVMEKAPEDLHCLRYWFLLEIFGIGSRHRYPNK